MKLNYDSNTGLIPAIIQDDRNQQVLMLGYMNEEALTLTKDSGWVTFYSRSRKEIWMKGETSGNKLRVISMAPDCDQDTLLIRAIPEGPTCHTGEYSCFGKRDKQGFLYLLEATIQMRKLQPNEASYTSSLFASGLNRIAQKVGEEAVELIIEAKDQNREKFEGEAADLLYHLLVLFAEKGTSLGEIEGVLAEREKE